MREQRRTNVMGPGGPVFSIVTATSATIALTMLQLRRAHLHYASKTTDSGPIDLIVTPADPTLADGKPLELLALGDSAMAGVGVTHPLDSLPAQLAIRLASSTGRPLHVISKARAGARTRDVLVDQLADAPRRNDLIVLLIGTNDVTHMTSARRLAADTANLLARLHHLGAPVVMSSLPEFAAMRAVPRIPRTVLQARAVRVRRIQRRAALEAQGVDLVDARARLGREFSHDPVLMSPDRFHSSAAGYSRIADVLAPAAAAAVAPDTDPAVTGRPSQLTPGCAA